MSFSLEELRRKQRMKIGQWVSEEILNHPIFNGSTLFQRLEFVKSQKEANELIAAKIRSMSQCDDLTVGEKELWHLLDKLIRERRV